MGAKRRVQTLPQKMLSKRQPPTHPRPSTLGPCLPPAK